MTRINATVINPDSHGYILAENDESLIMIERLNNLIDNLKAEDAISYISLGGNAFDVRKELPVD